MRRAGVRKDEKRHGYVGTTNRTAGTGSKNGAIEDATPIASRSVSQRELYKLGFYDPKRTAP